MTIAINIRQSTISKFHLVSQPMPNIFQRNKLFRTKPNPQMPHRPTRLPSSRLLKFQLNRSRLSNLPHKLSCLRLSLHFKRFKHNNLRVNLNSSHFNNPSSKLHSSLFNLTTPSLKSKLNSLWFRPNKSQSNQVTLMFNHL